MSPSRPPSCTSSVHGTSAWTSSFGCDASSRAGSFVASSWPWRSASEQLDGESSGYTAMRAVNTARIGI